MQTGRAALRWQSEADLGSRRRSGCVDGYPERRTRALPPPRCPGKEHLDSLRGIAAAGPLSATRACAAKANEVRDCDLLAGAHGIISGFPASDELIADEAELALRSST